MAQTLAPAPKLHLHKNDGTLNAGGKVFTYAPGTNTKKTTYSDSAGLVPNANPIILDARGEATIYGTGTYKVVHSLSTDTDPPVAPIWSQDNVAFPLDGAVTTVTSVALSLPVIFTVTGSPITTSGTLTATLASQTAALVFASPSGGAGTPTFRALVPVDLPLATVAQARAGTVTNPIGVDTFAGIQATQVLTDGVTTTWDMSLGFNAKWTLAGNRTLAVTNPKAGWSYVLLVYQDATGTRTVTWPATFNWGTTGAPTLTGTANKHDFITLFCTDAVTPAFDAMLGAKGF